MFWASITLTVISIVCLIGTYMLPADAGGRQMMHYGLAGLLLAFLSRAEYERTE